MVYGKRILNGNICGALIMVLASMSNATAANVVARPTTNTAESRVSATRPTQAAARMPTMTISASPSTSTSTTPTETAEPEPVAPVETVTVENKSSVFGSSLSAQSASQTDTAALNLAELVRAQRAALDAADAAAVVNAVPTLSAGNGENTCDTMLRECMIQRCGSNFAKCALDTDTTFGDKLDTCRRTTNCTDREYQLFANEIKSDRDFNATIANYNATIDCGNNYDSCIVAQCGATYSKCIGKSTGDAAIKKCESIAKSCIEYDSGLAMRAMAVFGELRQGAERQIAADEQKLYSLREQMRTVCTRLGAMFDERSLDCVYTVNFRAGDDATLFASKKLYAGSVFDCTPNWFGIDVTTYRENAFRATRAQTSASGAMLGSGLGQAAGAFTSGAIDRAVARFNAENALDDAINECIDAYGADAPQCQAKIEEKEKTTNNPSSQGAPQLPADIEKTLKDIQKKQDQKINDMVIDDPDITAMSLDPLENNFTVDSRQPNATEERQPDTPDESSQESTDNQPVVVDNSAIESKRQRQNCTLETLAGTNSKQCFKQHDNIPDDAIKIVRLFVGTVNETTKNDTRKPELRGISEVLPNNPEAFQISVVFPSITKEQEMESTCNSLNKATFCNTNATCKVSDTTFGTDDSTKQYGCSLFYNYKKNKHQ